MSKILNTQLNGIFNRIEAQELDIQMASQCLIQAIGGEGFVYIKGYDDLKFFESFIIESDESLRSSKRLTDLQNIQQLDSTDRVLLFGPTYTQELAHDVESLIAEEIDFVLICNRPKDITISDHLFHFIDLSTPRPIVYTEDYAKVVTPHPIAFNYIYYDIYTQMIEMVNDLDL
ncbi:DUF2529 domain-containing protein [Staphylococcus sp. ACRSN]|uniref:DUF2529 family protein n=1 Tax=Staphylococcus sp. ACRSN TaxID=2918214 RepID=UPI001EF39484|nr:DUF2529 family protein [Staphylococcus sp. ACRSN]MCG7339992.1 DUF2529 domain-containing protein [Staphylococcus sp. ACRSN]